MYTFSGGTLKIVQNKQYATLKNQYELTFSVHSTIHAASDDEDIQKQHYNFVKIENLVHTEVNATVDIIAIVRAATDVNEIVSAKMSGKVLHKRELTLVDDSLNEVRLTLWGDKAISNAHDWSRNPVVAFKGVKVGDYGGRSLNTLNTTGVFVMPDVPEGYALHKWRESFPNGQIPAGSSLSTSGAAGK